MRPRRSRAINEGVNGSEEDAMTSTSTFFIETACVAGIGPLGTYPAESRPVRARRARARAAAAAIDEALVDELLATFTDRWEW